MMDVTLVGGEKNGKGNGGNRILNILDWKEGDVVDCIGTIKTIGFINGKQHTSEMELNGLKDETMRMEFVPCLFVEHHTGISLVTDSSTSAATRCATVEILGMVQAIAAASSSSSNSQMVQHVQEGNHHENGGHSCSTAAAPWGMENGGIYVYGSQHAQIPIGPFQRRQHQSYSYTKPPTTTNNIGAGTTISTTPPRRTEIRLTANTRYLVTFLQHSSSPNHGLSKNDLALLLGCDCNREFQALEHAY